MNTRLKFPGIEINPTSDELNLMPDSNREAIFAIANGLNGGTVDYIVSGVNANITGSDATVEDGFVVINNEVLKVDAQTVPKTEGTNTYVFQKQTTEGQSPDWDRFFRDGSMHNVFQKDRAVVVNVASAGSNLLIDGPTLPEVLTPTLTYASSTTAGIITASKYNQFNVAEQNVQSDWNATSGDAFIQNKPDLDNYLYRIGTTTLTTWLYNSTTPLINPPGNDKLPMFCSRKAVAKVANAGWAVGEKQEIISYTYGISDMSLTQSTFRISSLEFYGINKTTGSSVLITPANWNLEITVWGYKP